MLSSLNPRMRAILHEVFVIACILAIVFAVRTYIFGLYQVPSGSMESTMLVGERFFADKLTYYLRSPRRGEIIAFNDANFDFSDNEFYRFLQEYIIPATGISWLPEGPQNWTKRIIGLPGETVEGKIEDGKPVVYVDGKKLDEPYINQYPLVHICTVDMEKCREDLVQQVKRGTVTLSDAEKIFMEQYFQSAGIKTFDPNRPFNDQPFYTIDPAHVERDVDGDPIVDEPGTPLQDRDYCPRGFNDGANYWGCTDEFHVELGPKQYWMMGDNRLGSQDSRYFGPVDERLIHGRIVFRIWSNDSGNSWWIFDLLFSPIQFFKNMRWNRFFQVVH